MSKQTLNTASTDVLKCDKSATGVLITNSVIINRLSRCVDIAMSLIEDIDSDSKHVSFVIKKNKILAFGVNRSMQTHPLAAKLNCRFETMHSELSAILKAKKSSDFYNATLVNIRLSSLSLLERRPVFRNSRPCSSCQKLIFACPEIRRVVYSTDSGWREYA